MEMKKSVKILFGFLLMGILGLSSCEELNTDPDTDPRAQYLGSWTCNESGVNYTVTIGLDPSNSAQILINNFHYFGANEKAYAIATQNNVTIPTQAILSNTIYGSGDLVNNNKITIKYYVNNQTDIDTINAVYTK
jgi:hypothetical protein